LDSAACLVRKLPIALSGVVIVRSSIDALASNDCQQHCASSVLVGLLTATYPNWLHGLAIASLVVAVLCAAVIL
jgi:hypothetical protein